METAAGFYLKGARDSLPIVLGYVPVSIAFAVLSLSTGFSPLQTIAMSLTCYSGAGQFLGVAMAGAGAGLAAAAIGMALINFRYFVMSLCVFARFKSLPFPARLVLSHFITDETFAIFTTNDARYVNVPYFLGLFTTSFLSWNSGTVIGIIASSVLPEAVTLALGIALYALFIAIVVPGARSGVRMCAVIVFVALFNSALSMGLSRAFGEGAASWSLVISMLGGAFIGAFFIKAPGEDAEEQGAQEAGKEEGR
ncbi:MAG: AzlC family ABC transporter permease [Succinivibrio sp.]